jgi:hypothetical protein
MTTAGSPRNFSAYYRARRPISVAADIKRYGECHSASGRLDCRGIVPDYYKPSHKCLSRIKHPEKVLGVKVTSHDQTPEVLQPGKQPLDLPPSSISLQPTFVLSIEFLRFRRSGATPSMP